MSVDSVQIFVRALIDGGFKTFTIELQKNSFIRDIAKRIAQKIRVSPMMDTNLSNFILLQYGQKPLEHAYKISDYNIHSESTLNATIKEMSVTSKAALNKEKIADLDKEYKEKIDEAASFVKLLKIKTEINSDFAQRRTQLLSEKMSITKILAKDQTVKERFIQTEISSITKQRDQVRTEVANIDEKITEHHEIIEQLKIQKQIVSTNGEAFEKKYNEQKKELDAVRLEIVKNLSEITEAKEELNDLHSNKCVKLNDCFEDAVKRVESKFMEWTADEVIEWIEFIENGRFNQPKLIKAIKELDINGKTLHDLRNDSVLKWIAGDVLCKTGRRIFIANIDRLLDASKNSQKNKNNCTICVDGKINAVFLPCGHQSACFECYQKRKNEFQKCPICRVKITKVVKTFMNGF